MIRRLVTQLGEKVNGTRMCALLDISRSGIYAARVRPPQKPPKACALQVHMQVSFAASGGTYGSRRLCQSLRAQGFNVGRHRTRTLMKKTGLKPCWRRKFRHTTDSRHDMPVASNVLNRQFTPEAPNRVCPHS